MAKIAEHFQLNLNILKQCREQIGMAQELVKEKIKSIAAIESGEKRPTYRQLDTLSDLYKVPRWVFIADELPEEYQYTNKPAFRKFKNSAVFENYKVRQVVNQVEQYRDLFIELRQDQDDAIQAFSLPHIENIEDISAVVKSARDWLSMNDDSVDFLALNEKLQEKKHLCIFNQ